MLSSHTSHTYGAGAKASCSPPEELQQVAAFALKGTTAHDCGLQGCELAEIIVSNVELKGWRSFPVAVTVAGLNAVAAGLRSGPSSSGAHNSSGLIPLFQAVLQLLAQLGVSGQDFLSPLLKKLIAEAIPANKQAKLMSAAARQLLRRALLKQQGKSKEEILSDK